MKVYLVLEEDLGSATIVCGVYSSLEHAEEFANSSAYMNVYEEEVIFPKD